MTKPKTPQIRFHGFTEEWEEKVLGEMMDVTSVKRIHQSDWTNSGIRFLRARDIVSFFKNEQQSDILYISLSKYLEYSSISGKVQKGDLLVTGVGTIGVPLLITDNNPIYFKDGNIIWFKNNNIIDGLFLFYSFSNNVIQNYIIESAGTGTVGTYTINSGKKTPILLPENKKEQTQIGNYFQKIDHLIAKTRNKLDKLKNMKQACLSKMFPQQGASTPQIRFSGFSDEWEVCKFGNCVLIQRGGSPRPIEEYITNDINGINWIKIGDVSTNSRYITSTKEKIKLEGESKSRRVMKGDLILSNSMSFGRPYIMRIDGCIHDGWLLIRDVDGLFDLEYLLQLLSSEYMFLQYKSLASGGVVNNLNSELVQSTIIQFPSIQEQTQIGNFFKNLDNLIALNEMQLAKLQNIKASCLDKMFVNNG